MGPQSSGRALTITGRARPQAAGELYKLEILDSILERDPQAPITIYHIGAARPRSWLVEQRAGAIVPMIAHLPAWRPAGDPGSEEHWWDLCAGPHVAATGDIAPDALDLESVAGLQPPACRRAPGLHTACMAGLLLGVPSEHSSSVGGVEYAACMRTSPAVGRPSH